MAYLEAFNELSPLDVAIFVCIEAIEDDSELLSAQEHSKLGHHLLEFKLVEDAILVRVELLKNARLSFCSK